MVSSDFSRINNFTKEEIKNTGADFVGINFESFKRLDIMRDILDVPVVLLKNGINSGNHKSKEHEDGKAFDVYIYPRNNTVIDYEDVFKLALKLGFKGIGVYYCKETGLYNYHFDTRNYFAFWSAWKIAKDDKWTYGSLFADPKDFTDIIDYRS